MSVGICTKKLKNNGRDLTSDLCNHDKIFLPLVSVSLQCYQEVPQEDGGTSYNLDIQGPDTIYPVGNGFLGVIPHGADNVCNPEEVWEMW